MTISTTRWRVKKAARTAVVAGSLASGLLAIRHLTSRRKTLRALTYHRFGESERDPWCVDERSFEAQMRWLAEKRLAVSLEEATRFVRGEIELPNNAVLVTIDDGFSSVLDIAAPIMRRYRIPSVAFITTDLVGKVRITGERYMTWDEVASLSEFGVTVGSHSLTHRSLAQLDPETAAYEAQQSRDELERQLGREVHSFAYPFGTGRDETPRTARLLADCGYTTAFIAQHGSLQRGADLTRLPRIKVEGGEPLWMFKSQCFGGMDAWKILDAVIWRLRRPSPVEHIVRPSHDSSPSASKTVDVK